MIKVLVPVVFSDYSLNALSFGINLAEKFPAEITILHCFATFETREDLNLSHDHADKGNLTARAELERREQEIREKLNLLTKQKVEALSAIQKKNITLKFRFEYGYPEDIIPKISEQEHCDVIIMGTKTKGETIKELLGSITSDVIQKVTAPVLAVPSHSVIDLSRIGKVLFLTEFNEQDYFSMHRLIRIIAPFDTEVHAIHFCQKEGDKTDIKRMEQFKVYCESTYRNHKIIFHILTGKVFVKTLEEYITNNDIDILAMTRKKRNILQRLFSTAITRKLLFQTDIPLLVFHS